MDGRGEVEGNLFVIVPVDPAGEFIALKLGRLGRRDGLSVIHIHGRHGLIVAVAGAEADQPGAFHIHGLSFEGIVGEVQGLVGVDGDDEALVEDAGRALARAGVLRVGGAACAHVIEVQGAHIPFGIHADLIAGELGRIVAVVVVAVVVAPEEDDLMVVAVLVQHVDDVHGMGGVAGVVPEVQGEVGQDEDGGIGGGGRQPLVQLGDVLFHIVVLVLGGNAAACAEAVDDIVVGHKAFAHLAQPLGGFIVGIRVQVVAAGRGEPFVVAQGVDGVAHLALVDHAVHEVHDGAGPGPEILGVGGIGGAHVAAEADGVDIAHAGVVQPGLQVHVVAVPIVDVGGEGQGDGAVLILHGVAVHGLRGGENDLLCGFGLGGLRSSRAFPDKEQDLGGFRLTEGRAVEAQGVLAAVEDDGLAGSVIHEGAQHAAVPGKEAAGAGKDELAGIAYILQMVAAVGNPDGGGVRRGDGIAVHRDLDSAHIAVDAGAGQGKILAFILGDDQVLLSGVQRSGLHKAFARSGGSFLIGLLGGGFLFSSRLLSGSFLGRLLSNGSAGAYGAGETGVGLVSRQAREVAGIALVDQSDHVAVVQGHIALAVSSDAGHFPGLQLRLHSALIIQGHVLVEAEGAVSFEPEGILDAGAEADGGQIEYGDLIVHLGGSHVEDSAAVSGARRNDHAVCCAGAESAQAEYQHYCQDQRKGFLHKYSSFKYIPFLVQS